MSRLTLSFICLLLGTMPIPATAETGFRQITLDPQGDRPLALSLWYPTKDRGAAETVGENAAFLGIPVLRDATPAAGAHPLVLLSHGYGGSWRNLNWLAERLVDGGYIVAAPDHPGTTTFNRDPAQAAALFQRPRDLGRSADALLADPALAGRVDADRIAAIGHSLGGWTVAAMAGARFAPDQFAADCARNTSPRSCALSAELGLNDPAIEGGMQDPRLRAFVSLDLGLARGFTPESLQAIEIPALIVSAGVDIGDLPASLESGWLTQHMPADHARSWVIPDAMHFSFMGICKPGAEAMIEAEEPGDGIVCRDAGTRSRQDIHAELAREILAFLAQNLTVR